jgi:hypothetical protein
MIPGTESMGNTYIPEVKKRYMAKKGDPAFITSLFPDSGNPS